MTIKQPGSSLALSEVGNEIGIPTGNSMNIATMTDNTHPSQRANNMYNAYGKSWFQRNNAGNCDNSNIYNCACDCGNTNCTNCINCSNVDCVNCDTRPWLQNNCNCACTYNCNSRQCWTVNCVCDCNGGGE